MSKYTVRSAQPSDLDMVLELAERFFRESGFRTLTYDRACYHAHLTQYIIDPKSDIIMVFDGSNLAGYIVIFCTREYTVEPLGDQYQFYVAPEYRGKGVSRMLVAAAEDRFDDWGCVISGTAADPLMEGKNNILFENLWKKFGYKKTGILMFKDRRNG